MNYYELFSCRYYEFLQVVLVTVTFIHYADLYRPFSRLLFRSAHNPKQKSFQARMCRKEPWAAITVPMEAHSTLRDQPPRMHGSALWKSGQKGY